MNTDDEPLKTPNQCYRLKAYLSAMGSCTSLEARRLLDILEPASRICELRKQGLSILTIRIPVIAANGGTRQVAQYILKTGGLAK